MSIMDFLQSRGDIVKKGPSRVNSKAFGYLRIPFTGSMD